MYLVDKHLISNIRPSDRPTHATPIQYNTIQYNNIKHKNDSRENQNQKPQKKEKKVKIQREDKYRRDKPTPTHALSYIAGHMAYRGRYHTRD
ncbi:hypothetical protein P280DRAFT_465554 [Massarina eburnea CBS 473.64]|uniref:Uncharacterized protein n=1 Tax=Massarina eburnea CBS 473.64 TaxID=1395130 RepID=A0A6A6SGJ0_9PLEO|nr:hypothetical protein P280DRAFT_465554 [Massarina eburnea CBS 473.64]